MLRRAKNPAAGLPTTRLEALVDGTAAIVMTLLVLELRLPDVAAGDELLAALRHLLPEVAAFAMSVAVIGVFWLGHAHQFNFIARVDRALVGVNVLGLGFAALVPFTTALLGRHWGDPLATALWGANVLALGLVGMLHWWYASRRGHLAEHAPPEASRSIARRTVASTGIAALGVAVAWLSPAASVALYALAFLPWASRGTYEDHLRPAK